LKKLLLVNNESTFIFFLNGFTIIVLVFVKENQKSVAIAKLIFLNI